MARYIALLRGINVGGHRVKMEDLRALFVALGFANVETFIASGNVIFETDTTDTLALAARIEQHLQQALGYSVATFLRTPAELAAITAYTPFPHIPPTEGHTLAVLFMAQSLPAHAHATLATFETSADALHTHGREIYWLSRGRMSDSLVDWPLFAKTLPLATTTRNITTVRKLAAKCPAD